MFRLYRLFAILHQSLSNLVNVLRSNAPENGLRLSNRHSNGSSTFHRRHQMSANDRSLRTRSTTAFLFLAKTKIRRGIALSSTLLLAIAGLGQEAPPPQQPNPHNTSPGAVSSAKPTPEATTITVPGGTSIALVLTHPIQSRYIHHGD